MKRSWQQQFRTSHADEPGGLHERWRTWRRLAQKWAMTGVISESGAKRCEQNYLEAAHERPARIRDCPASSGTGRGCEPPDYNQARPAAQVNYQYRVQMQKLLPVRVCVQLKGAPRLQGFHWLGTLGPQTGAASRAHQARPEKLSGPVWGTICKCTTRAMQSGTWMEFSRR